MSTRLVGLVPHVRTHTLRSGYKFLALESVLSVPEDRRLVSRPLVGMCLSGCGATDGQWRSLRYYDTVRTLTDRLLAVTDVGGRGGPRPVFTFRSRGGSGRLRVGRSILRGPLHLGESIDFSRRTV